MANGMTVKFTSGTGAALGKLADAELHFTEGPLAGLKLIGFGVWQRRNGKVGDYNVTFPARQYSVNGERRAFALLRPAHEATTEGVRDVILAAFSEWQLSGEATDVAAVR